MIYKDSGAAGYARGQGQVILAALDFLQTGFLTFVGGPLPTDSELPPSPLLVQMRWHVVNPWNRRDEVEARQVGAMNLLNRHAGGTMRMTADSDDRVGTGRFTGSRSPGPTRLGPPRGPPARVAGYGNLRRQPACQTCWPSSTS